VLAVNTLPTPPDATTELFKVTGSIDADPLTGRISFSPTTAQTDEDPDTYFYDAQVKDAAGGLITFVEGKFKITQDRAKD
jgi:predicted Ser/Thr protein kinase